MIYRDIQNSKADVVAIVSHEIQFLLFVSRYLESPIFTLLQFYGVRFERVCITREASS